MVLMRGLRALENYYVLAFLHGQCSSYGKIQKPQAFMETFTLVIKTRRTLEEDMVLK